MKYLKLKQSAGAPWKWLVVWKIIGKYYYIGSRARCHYWKDSMDGREANQHEQKILDDREWSGKIIGG